jgi:hypothetical protein
MAVMNGPGDLSKPSAAAIKAQKKAALAKALETKNLKKLQAEKKASAKVIQMKKPARSVAKKSAKKIQAPVKKAAANKKVIRKTMKTRSKR